DTVSIAAFWASRASRRRIGAARWLMRTDSPWLLGNCGAATSVIRPPATVMRTCTGPYLVWTIVPVNVPACRPGPAVVGPGRPGAGRAVVVGAGGGGAVPAEVPGAAAASSGAVAAACVPWPAANPDRRPTRSAVPAAVPRTATTARRTADLRSELERVEVQLPARQP